MFQGHFDFNFNNQSQMYWNSIIFDFLDPPAKCSRVICKEKFQTNKTVILSYSSKQINIVKQNKIRAQVYSTRLKLLVRPAGCTLLQFGHVRLTSCNRHVGGREGERDRGRGRGRAAAAAAAASAGRERKKDQLTKHTGGCELWECSMAGIQDFQQGSQCHRKTWINILLGILQLLLPYVQHGGAQRQGSYLYLQTLSLRIYVLLAGLPWQLNTRENPCTVNWTACKNSKQLVHLQTRTSPCFPDFKLLQWANVVTVLSR